MVVVVTVDDTVACSCMLPSRFFHGCQVEMMGRTDENDKVT